MPCSQASSITTLILNESTIPPSREDTLRHAAVDWSNFTRLSTLQLAVNGLTTFIMDNIKELLSRGRALQEVTITSGTVTFKSYEVTFVLSQIRKRTEHPVFRLRLPMLGRFHLNITSLQFLRPELMQELCVPIKQFLPVTVRNDLLQLHKVYLHGHVFRDRLWICVQGDWRLATSTLRGGRKTIWSFS